MRSYLMTFPILLAIGLSTWSFMTLTQNKPAAVPLNPNEGDVFMENVVATIMNKEGMPALKLESPKMVHHAENDTIFIDTPHVTVYRDSPQPWYIDAHFAKTIKGAEEITFWENVIIHHLADVNNPNTTLFTHSLTIVPDKKIARTEEAILITQPAFTIHSVGMTANLNEGTIKLISNTSEDYAANS